MKVVNLASGSDGNCTFLQTREGCFLVDMGLSAKEITKRLDLIKIKPNNIDAIFVTHAHTDHIKGIETFCCKDKIDVYASADVWKLLNLKIKKIPKDNCKKFGIDDFVVKDLKVIPIVVPHDTPCCAYSFENEDKKISILTDLGHTNDKILKCIEKSQLVYLEANYDKGMLAQNPKYPLVLKKRISGKFGHLSNDDAAAVVDFLARTGTKQIVLSHLSKHNNQPDLAYEYICNLLATSGIIEGVHIKIDVASMLPGVMFNLK